ncbi:hypothetical protein DFH06DRAFT_1343098 [Mycena polygramma]|nr:hypothetical protein DFH06DRAFT_1343098 [Mycena polygramma]
MAPKPAVKKVAKAGTKTASKKSKISALKDISNHTSTSKGETEASRTRFQKRQAAKRGRGAGGPQATEGDAPGEHYDMSPLARLCYAARYYVEPMAIEPPFNARRSTEGEFTGERDNSQFALLCAHAAALLHLEGMASRPPLSAHRPTEGGDTGEPDTSGLALLAYAASLRSPEPEMAPQSPANACGSTEKHGMEHGDITCPLALLAYAALEYPDRGMARKTTLV